MQGWVPGGSARPCAVARAWTVGLTAGRRSRTAPPARVARPLRRGCPGGGPVPRASTAAHRIWQREALQRGLRSLDPAFFFGRAVLLRALRLRHLLRHSRHWPIAAGAHAARHPRRRHRSRPPRSASGDAVSSAMQPALAAAVEDSSARARGSPRRAFVPRRPSTTGQPWKGRRDRCLRRPPLAFTFYGERMWP